MQDAKFVPDGDNDLARLMEAMEQLQSRHLKQVDESVFDDKNVALAFNNMLAGVMGHNNEYLMRINDAQSRIADSSNVKKLIEQVRMQKGTLDHMKEASDYLGSCFRKNEEEQIEILAYAKQVNYALKSLLGQFAAGKTALDQGDLNTAAQMYDNLLACLQMISEQARMIQQVASGLYEKDNVRGEMFTVFDEGVDTLTKSYDELFENCFQHGSHLYRISRDIDNARNDMYRNNSSATMIDCTKIFAVDHLTLTWRLYNNIIEYEHLKITQLNNPDRCKFGLWCAGITNPLIKDSEEFQAAVKAHEELHRHAVACYVAKEASDIPEAMKEFEYAREACNSMGYHLDRLAEFMKQNGLDDETEVWVFKQ